MKPAPAGDIKIAQVVKIAKMKLGGMNATELKPAVLTVLGTCLSIGVTCEGVDPRAIAKKIKKGEYDSVLK